jgi:hypothetical protein
MPSVLLVAAGWLIRRKFLSRRTLKQIEQIQQMDVLENALVDDNGTLQLTLRSLGTRQLRKAESVRWCEWGDGVNGSAFIWGFWIDDLNFLGDASVASSPVGIVRKWLLGRAILPKTPVCSHPWSLATQAASRRVRST